MRTFLARQPIFDRSREVYAYELLFRAGEVNRYKYPDSDRATCKLIADSVSLFGLETLTGGRRAFINVTREILVRDYVSLLPAGMIGVEILEGIEPDAEVIAACEKLKREGYPLILDDFVYAERYEPLLRLADIIKIDLLATPAETQEAMVQKFRPRGILMLAEKVETHEAYERAWKAGYDYFQGFFFCEPIVLEREEVPAVEALHLELLREIHQPRLDLDTLETLIKHEISIAYRLLRYVNSVLFGWRAPIRSIRQALTLLGDKGIRRWVSVVILAGMAKEKPEELLVDALVRAKFCESLAPHAGLGHRKEDLYLLGMFSLADAILDRPLVEVLREIPIAEDVREALLGEEGSRLRDVYDYVVAYERGDWDRRIALAERLGIDEGIAAPLYKKALEWGRATFVPELLRV
ncbi:MAG TPA: HDOD domain-containing protein [Planctomycetota bacterium]|nr:HDOD domain-containing protein [Planctomycetota bacterium]